MYLENLRDQNKLFESDFWKGVMNDFIVQKKTEFKKVLNRALFYANRVIF